MSKPHYKALQIRVKIQSVVQVMNTNILQIWQLILLEKVKIHENLFHLTEEEDSSLRRVNLIEYNCRYQFSVAN